LPSAHLQSQVFTHQLSLVDLHLYSAALNTPFLKTILKKFGVLELVGEENLYDGTALAISSVTFNPIRTVDSASNDETMFTSENQPT
jgi:hypothetical protein|tara:strand:- start:139 stop:399 length:261 start_codon:yes stop_codon:yes gene_type:complete